MPDHNAIPRGERAAHPPGYVQNTNPGAVGAFKPWWVTDDDDAPTTLTDVRVRNADNDAWISLASTIVVAAPVSSVFGRTGAVVAAEGDYGITQLSDVTIASAVGGHILIYDGGAWVNRVLVAADIPSLDAAIITSGQFSIDKLAVGTPDGTQFIRDDGTLAVPSGTGAPTTIDYLVKTADAGLSAERVVTDGTQITFDWSTPGQVLAVIVSSVALAGDPTTTTQAAGNNTTRIATTAFVKAAIDVVLGGVAGAFDTLSEIVTELALKAPLASPTFTGVPAAPTAAAGTNTTQAATTAFVKTALDAQAECIIVAVSDETTALTTGDAKITFHFPFAFVLSSVAGGLSTVSSSGAVTVDVNEAGSTIFSTKITIDQSEDHSKDATPSVLSDTAIAAFAKMTVDIDGAGTGAKGLKLYFYGTRVP